MPFDRESLRKKTEKRAELNKDIRTGNITRRESLRQMSSFARSLDEYGFCDRDTIQTLDSSDIE